MDYEKNLSSLHKEGLHEWRKQRISLDVIVKRNLPSVASSEEAIIEAAAKLRYLRLDREHITHIDCLELCHSITHLYLQKNRITKIENLESVLHLQFLCLADNLINEIENLRHLKHLMFLDLSQNNISVYDPDELPSALVILNLKGNNCEQNDDLMNETICGLPRLRQLNEQELQADDEDAGPSSAKQADDMPSFINTWTRILDQSVARTQSDLTDHQVRLGRIRAINDMIADSKKGRLSATASKINTPNLSVAPTPTSDTPLSFSETHRDV